MNMLQHKGYFGSAEVSLEDDVLHGKIEHISALVTYEAHTVAKLKQAFEEAVEDYLQTRPMNIDKIVKAIEEDAGESIPGLKEGLQEMQEGQSALKNVQEYDRLVKNLDAVLDAGGADENHPLASLADRMGDLVAGYDDVHYNPGNQVIGMLKAGVIETEADYRHAMASIEQLMDAKPEEGSKEGNLLDRLATLVQAYESKHYPL